MTSRQLLDTKTVNLNDILRNGKIYKVPTYQRDYAWEEENWDDLWADILTVLASNDPHYMGSIVLQNMDNRTFTIIDGQQRLATLSILILATIQNLQHLIDIETETEANIERKELLIEYYLGSKDAVSLRYSSKLFLNENDDSFYQSYLLQLRRPNNPHRLTSSEKRLWNAYEYFREKIRQYFSESLTGAKLAAFITQQVAEQLVFIQITVDDELNAYTVFETLNARGIDLTTTDLLKNYLLSVSSQSTQDQRLAKEQWQRIIRITGLDDFPKFLRYYWNSTSNFVRKDRLFKTIRQAIRSRQEAFDLLDKLENVAAIYAALEDPNDELWNGIREIRNRVRELQLFNVKQCYPLLLISYTKFSSADFERILRLCTVISFRYNVIASLNPNLQEDAYNQAAQRLFQGEISQVSEVARLLKNIYPPDEEFVNAFSTRSINTRRNKKLVRYILYCLENQTSGTDRDFEDESGTIEHILPENPSHSWDEAFDPESQSNFIYRLGNLTLLETTKNRDCQNKPYSEKQLIYQTSQYHLTQMIQYPEWTVSQLKSRQIQLARIATAIWRIPELQS